MANAAVLEALGFAAAKRQRQRHAPPPDWLAYADRPAAWMQDRLGAFTWSMQREIAEAVAQHRRVAVHSAHAIGKSFLAARLAAWWIDTHPPGEAFVVTTAPTNAQVKAVLWREMRRAHRAGHLAGHTNQTEWWIDDEMVAFGRKPADYDPSALQGIHARYVLVILDEAGGVPEEIYRAAQSLAANALSRILAIGNPDDPSGYFATVCKPGSGWHAIRVDGLQTPNFTGEPIPDELHDLLLSPEYVQELEDELGTDSAVYVSKVRGQFPENTADGVVLLSWVRACQRLDRDYAPRDLLPVELGVDVGAGGDETVVRERRGMVAGRTWRKRTPDWAESVALVLSAIQETGATSVKVDTIGIGWGVAGRLRELAAEGRHRAAIISVNVGEASTQPERFPKLRDQLWWEVGRELSRTQGWDLAAVDDVTVGQLVAPLYKPDSAGRIQVERKADTRKRLKRSPDDADALLLAYYTLPVVGRPFAAAAGGTRAAVAAYGQQVGRLAGGRRG